MDDFRSTYVSFIIPSFNVGDVISECLKSVADVDYPKNNFEIIVVDNNSNDNTRDIAKEFTDKVYVRNRVTIAKLRNDGMKESQGDFLIFIDSDCVIHRDWVKIALSHFDNPNVGLVGPKSYLFPENVTWVGKTWKVHLDTNKSVENPTYLPTRSIMTRKEIFLKVGMFDETLETGEDFDFGQRIKKQYKIISDERLAYIHLREPKNLSELFSKERWRGKEAISVWLKEPKRWQRFRNVAFIFFYLGMLVITILSFVEGLFTRNLSFFFIALGITIIPLAILSVNTCARTGKYPYLFKLFIVYSVYILARITAIINFRKQ